MTLIVNPALEPVAPPPEARSGSAGVPAVGRCVAIMRFLGARHRDGASLAEIASALAITKSHCLNILRTLTKEGWLSYDAHRRRYSLGPALLDDFSSLLGRDGRAQRIHEALVHLAAQTGCPSILTRVEDDGSFVVVDKVETGDVPTSGPIGHRYPWDAPAQLRARLAWSEPDVQQKLLRKRRTPYTRHTLLGRKAMLAELEETRARGYAKAHSEYVTQVVSYAVPLLDLFGTVRAILQCPTLPDGLDEREAALVAALLQAQARIQPLL